MIGKAPGRRSRGQRCVLVRLRTRKTMKLPAGHFKHELFQQCTCRRNAGKPTSRGILHRAKPAAAQESPHFGALRAGIV
ncbi:hypothetical protein PO002_43800 [Cupriavidus necator]|uniref:hypothetical protein n=1 Tax=Cupriavidus necator TaxID=106590 RepID=UPI0039C04148